jgi:hypothetical protein
MRAVRGRQLVVAGRRCLPDADARSLTWQSPTSPRGVAIPAVVMTGGGWLAAGGCCFVRTAAGETVPPVRSSIVAVEGTIEVARRLRG